MCSYLCVCVCAASSQESPCAFFPSLDNNNRSLFYFLSVTSSDFVCVRICAHMCVHVCVCLSWTLCKFNRASPSIYVHTKVSLYVMRCVCHPQWLFVVLSARPPWPRAAIYFFRLLIQRLLSEPITISRAPWPPTVPSFCLLHAKHRVKTKWPRLFVYFPPLLYSKWSHTFPQELPSIQHLACVLLSMLRWIWQIWATYIMVKETDNAIQMEAAEELLETL